MKNPEPPSLIIDWGEPPQLDFNFPIEDYIHNPDTIKLWMKNEEDLNTNWAKDYTEDDIQPIIVENK